MADGPYFPLFCTIDTSFQTVNQVVQAAYDEQNLDPRRCNSWVLIQTRDQQIFPMPSPLVSRFTSDFLDCTVNELGAFCRAHFAQTGLVCNEDFAVIDSRTLEDNTLLFVRWEQFTPEDDAILRLVWGDATLRDEAWLDNFDLTVEDQALLRKLQGKATISDEILLRDFKEGSLRDDRHILEVLREVQDAAADDTIEDDPRSDPSLPDSAFLEVSDQAATLEALQLKSPLSQPPLESPRISKAGHDAIEHEQHHDNIKAEILEGWRTIRIPVTTAMRDTRLIFRRSITDLLKIRSLFDQHGVLRY